MRYIENVNLIQKLRKFGYKPRHSEFISEDTLYDVMDWFREEKKILITIYSVSFESWTYNVTTPGADFKHVYLHAEDFYTYDDALEEAIITIIDTYEINTYA